MNELEFYFFEAGIALGILLIISGFGITNSPWYTRLKRHETRAKFYRSK